ncbi:hypothetical protein [Pseudalkalibacillus sp. NRS-1564]|uniref:hypothetical protein n=1 Tax=Pseudalkalibacillus sp. NRS-1564 TaxID=3233900 RepID=UPI003D2C66E4
MKILSQERFEAACSFVRNHARPVDREYFAFWKGNGDKESVLKELEEFRNKDGGFGNNLEPDFRLKESSPMATSVAFQYMTQLDLDSDHPFVKDGLHYLRSTYQVEKQSWQAVPHSVNSVPHAPWWKVTEGDVAYSANPDAEIVGYFLHYGSNYSITSESLAKVMNHLDSLNEYEIHEVQCYLRLAQLAGGKINKKIHEKIKQKLPYIIDRPEKWDHYGVQPVVLVESDQSPFAKELNQELQVNLDYLIQKQLSNGSWEPSWSWGQYEDSWEGAKKEWQGFLTVQNLITLSKFGRIES